MPDTPELQDRAYQAIRRKILDGRVRKPKDLSRRVLQAELGVSSTCVQVALARLEGERLLESRPQSGTFLRQIDFKEYCDHYELREWVEPAAAAVAATKITAAQLKILRQSCTAYADFEAYWRTGPALLTDAFLDRCVAAENAFHGTIMAASGNATAAHVIENLRVMNYNRLMNHALPPPVMLTLTVLTRKEHEAILAALEAGDGPAAERRMRKHLNRGRRYVMDLDPA